MPDRIPDMFDLLRPEGRQGEKFDEAIAALRAGVADSAIRKVVLDGVKSTLGRAADKAWGRHVQEPFFYAGRFYGARSRKNAKLLKGMRKAAEAGSGGGAT